MPSTAEIVREILPEAVEQVSDGGTMVFSMRNLFYAVRQLFLTKFFVCPGVTRGMLHEVCGAKVRLKEPPDLYVCEKGHEVKGEDLEPAYEGVKWYKKYNSFTQDFLRQYEKIHGKIERMYREQRGSYIFRWTKGGSNVYPIGGRESKFSRGVSNKVIAVEKQGIFGVMAENRFHIRLDGMIMSTQGFTIEAGRELMKEAEEKHEALKVCVLHDYDINGLLIASTLTHPTKRIDLHVGEVVDLGLTWEIINKLMRERGLIPEPVELTKGDVGKVEGMFERGEISQEEFSFLLNKTTERYDAWKRKEKVGPKEILARGYRVELNALRPSELLEWLEKRLEDLDLWKTVPEQEELDETMKDQMKADLDATKRSLVEELKKAVQDKLGLTEILRAIGAVLEAIEAKVDEEISERMEDIDYPTKDVADFKEDLKENMLKYWSVLAEEIAGELAEDLAEPLKEKVEEEEDGIIEEGMNDEDVEEAKDNLAKDARTWLQEQGYDLSPAGP